MFKNVLRTTCVIAVLTSIGVYASTNDINIEDDGFVGKFYPSSSSEKRVGVLVLGGSEGGLPNKLAKPIADAGFPTLALAYFNAEGLPQELEKIPLEYFDQPKVWLQKQANVKSDELIIVGWSKGAELALLLASRDQRVARVVAIAPSSAIWAGILKDWTKIPGSSWTEKGKELAHIPFNPTGKVNGLLDLYTQSFNHRSDKGTADIPVDNIKANIVLMTGENDEVWPSPHMARLICDRMNSSKQDSCEHLNYSGLDHLLDYKFADTSDSLNETFVNALTDGSGN